jgi:MFS family permease
MLVSLLGDGIYLVAVAFAVLAISNDAAALSLVGLAFSIGLVGFLLAGGVLADRYDKRRLLLTADGVRLVAVATVGVLDLAHVLELWHLVGLALVYGIGEGLAAPALGAIVPELVPESALVEANSLQQMVKPLAYRLAGPAIGGLVFAALGTGGAFLVDAGTFAVSIACLLAMRGSAVVPAGAHEPMVRQLREAGAFVRSQTWLWATLLASAIGVLAFMGPVEVLVPYIIKNEHDAGAGAFGLVLAANGAGAVLGTVIVGQRGVPRHEVSFLYWAWGLATFAIAGYALATAIWQLMALSLLFGIGLGLGNPVWATLMQVRVPAALRGRVTSLDWLVSLGLTPLSFALTGPIAAVAGADATLIGAGLIAGASTIGLLYAVPGLREEDGGLDRATRRAAAPGRP